MVIRSTSALAVAVVACVVSVPDVVRSEHLPGAPAGLIETGTPPFSVIAPETLGMTQAPTDIHLLKDGRLLAFNRIEIAIGDGVHWELIRRASGEEDVGSISVAIAESGEIYAGVDGGFARIDFGEDGTWRFKKIAELPATEP